MGQQMRQGDPLVGRGQVEQAVPGEDPGEGLAEVGDEIVVDTDPAPGEEPARLRIVVVEIDGMRIETVHVIVEAVPDETDVRAEDEEVAR